ncbi:MAG TPA: heparan-alpha-glucosaminide N-acetyltransferase domain-containing protein, partial [Clostridia bacterium]|nr:heparan-alpha-glucosaminide N-acetyltransferase domain-containing protein [Clostridia bacterium]
MKLKLKPNRIWELDFLRGFAILMVIIDHSMFDFSSVFPAWQSSGVLILEDLYTLGNRYMTSDIRVFWRPAFLFLFFITSGLCTAFSRNNFLRGIRLSIVALLVSLVTYYAGPIFSYDLFVMFGVLHCMAAIIIIYSVVSFIVELCVRGFYKIKKMPFNDKTYNYTLSFICFILSIGFYFINRKY